jgi:hypothetical protein
MENIIQFLRINKILIWYTWYDLEIVKILLVTVYSF